MQKINVLENDLIDLLWGVEVLKKGVNELIKKDNLTVCPVLENDLVDHRRCATTTIGPNQ